MRPNGTLFALAAALSAAVAAPSFAAGAPPVPVLQVAAAKYDDAGEGRTAGDDFGVRPEVMARLSPEQIASILREREMRRPRFPSRPDPVGMALFFGSLLAMVTIAQVFATRRERIRQQTLLAMVEKGLEIPHDLIAMSAGPSADLRRGLVLVGAGLGLSLLFAIVRMNGQGAAGLWSIGLIPMLMGAGYLLAWRIEYRKNLGR